MVDTKDSKSFVSNGGRVQVSSPVDKGCLKNPVNQFVIQIF